MPTGYSFPGVNKPGPNIQPAFGAGRGGLLGGGRGFGSATDDFFRRRLQYAGGLGREGNRPAIPGGKGYPNIPSEQVYNPRDRKFNLFEGYPGIDPRMYDPESFVRIQQRGPYQGRQEPPERLGAISEAALRYRGMGPSQARMGTGAQFGDPSDALRRLLMQRMGAL